MKKQAVSAALVVLMILVSGCSSTTTQRTIQNLDNNEDEAVIVYGEREHTQTMTLFGPQHSFEQKDQRVAFCDKVEEQFNCSSMPVIIDGEPLTIEQTDSIFDL